MRGLAFAQSGKEKEISGRDSSVLLEIPSKEGIKNNMKKQYLEVGKIVAPSGLKGEVRLQPWADSPGFLLSLKTLYFDGGKTPVKVERARVQKNVVVLKLSGTNDADAANALRGRVLWFNRDDVKLGERTYYVQDLIGLTVVDADNGEIVYGTLKEVSPTGANDVYHIEKDGKIVLIPAIRQVVVETDLDNGIMRIRPLEGLFDNAD